MYVYICMYMYIYVHVYLYILLASSLPTPVFLYGVCMCCESVYQCIFLSATLVFLRTLSMAKACLLVQKYLLYWYKSTNTDAEGTFFPVSLESYSVHY